MQDTRVDVIRHGEPLGGRRYRGHGVDDPLSPAGWEQMRQALGGRPHWDQILSSPMRRCRLFASALAQRHALPLAIDPAFREIGMGAWEGRLHAEVAATEPDRLAVFQRDPVGGRPPGAEPLAVFLARIADAYERQIAAYPGRRLLIVCHAGVTRAILGHVMRADPERWSRIRIDHAGISRIRAGRFAPSVEFVNRRSLE
ncbi:histidine phosphatase family protein [Thiocystis violacea]|uniref:histidine phosphatase family protein n=1 Tax=Thiocystis violacea TaxID=13725 RepID=UPI001906AB9E|nr:histidine phosphatase family protein [Thiocystis violacea]MBK1717855.1 histidine phosphatase family protein [Thiocystis violacea]